MLVTTGADCLSAAVFGSGELEVHGEASGTVLQGGVELVANGGVNRNATVSSGGSEDLADNGSAVGTLVLSGGDLLVDAGGTAISVTLSGGFMRVGGIDAFFDDAEALAIRTSVAAGTLLISTGGTAISGFIGGTAIVEAGGVALDLEFGGVLNLSRSGGTSLMTTALHGSEERVAGIAISTVVDFGGMLNVSGGTAIGAHVLAGSAIVQALGVALGIGVGGTLKLSAAAPQLTPISTKGWSKSSPAEPISGVQSSKPRRRSLPAANPTMPCSLLPRRPFRAAASRCERSSRPLAKSLCWRAAHRCKRPCSIDRSRLWRGERSERWSNPAAE